MAPPQLLSGVQGPFSWMRTCPLCTCSLSSRPPLEVRKTFLSSFRTEEISKGGTQRMEPREKPHGLQEPGLLIASSLLTSHADLQCLCWSGEHEQKDPQVLQCLGAQNFFALTSHNSS